MYRIFPRRSKKAGLSPGTLVHLGKQKTETVRLSYLDYNEAGHFDEGEIEAIETFTAAADEDSTTWLNVTGLHEIEVIQAIGQHFQIHPLLLEDILNTDQRPKVEEQGRHLYIILKMIQWNEAIDQIEVEQVSLILGKTLVITFQEQEKDVFDPVRQRIREGKGRIRAAGADYLAYTLLDVIVDHYFVILENLGELIELIEIELVDEPTRETLQEIQRIKRELLFLRRSIWPLREVVGRLQRGEFVVFQAENLLYLRDVYEHTVQVIDTVETFRDIVSGLLDIYLSSISNKTNEVMKVLTIIATIFIPLTFFTSIYGMNFEYMPELGWRWSYPILWLFMLMISGAMIYYFKRKDWF